MKRLLCAIICFAAVALHASDTDYSYNPSEISVSLPGNNNGQSQIKIYGGWFDVPIGVGAKIMGGNSPISVCNDALYYLKIGDREKLSSFYPPKDRQKVLSSRIKFMDRQIKGYVSSGEYCFIIFANGSFMPLKLISGKWTISTNEFPHDAVLKFYPILESLKRSEPSFMRVSVKGGAAKDKDEESALICKKIIDEFRNRQVRKEGIRSFYLAYIFCNKDKVPHAEFVKLTNSANDPRVNVKMKKQDDSTFGADIKCDFGKISYNASVPVPDRDGIEVLLGSSYCVCENEEERAFIILFSL